MIERAVLTDVGPLYAALNRRDQYHERATVDLAAIAAEQRLITILYPTVLEAYSLILKRHPPSVASGWLEDIAVDTLIVDVEETDYLRAFEIVRRYTDQPVTLFDALMSAYADRSNLLVWTYDHHFDILGAQRWYPGN
jgi:predicted nucleic acid-binding protein